MHFEGLGVLLEFIIFGVHFLHFQFWLRSFKDTDCHICSKSLVSC